MNLFLRLLWTRFASRFRGRCGPLGPVRTPFRVLPTDLDVLRHVNNGTYLSMLDLARTDLIMRSGLLGRLNDKGWFAVVASESIRFRQSLRLFQRFVVETRVVGWDDRAIYIHHRFIRGDDVVATAFIAARFLRREGGTVAPDRIVELAADPPPQPPLPDWAQRLAQAHAEIPS